MLAPPRACATRNSADRASAGPSSSVAPTSTTITFTTATATDITSPARTPRTAPAAITAASPRPKMASSYGRCRKVAAEAVAQQHGDRGQASESARLAGRDCLWRAA